MCVCVCVCVCALTNSRPETGPDIDKTAVHYNSDSHFPFDISIPNIGSRNNNSEFADIYHGSVESGDCKATERRTITVKRPTASGNCSVGIYRTHQSAPDHISPFLQPATEPAAANCRLVQSQHLPILGDCSPRTSPFCVPASLCAEKHIKRKMDKGLQAYHRFHPPNCRPYLPECGGTVGIIQPSV